MISGFMFQITFKKLILVWFWYNIRDEYLQLSGNSPPFSNYYLWKKQIFFIYFNKNKILYRLAAEKKCKNTTIFDNDIKEISINVKQCHTFQQNFSLVVIFSE